MKFSLKTRYLMSHCLDCHQAFKDLPEGIFQDFTVFCDLGLISKVKSQFIDVKFPLKMRYFF